MSNTYQKKSRRAQPDPRPAEVAVPEQVIVSMGEIAESERGQSRRRRATLYTTVYELDSPAAVETKEFTAMRGWGRFAPHVRSQTRIVAAL